MELLNCRPRRGVTSPKRANTHLYIDIITYMKRHFGEVGTKSRASLRVCPLCLIGGLHLRLTNWRAQSHDPVTETLSAHYLLCSVHKGSLIYWPEAHRLYVLSLLVVVCSFFTGTLWNSSEDSLLPEPSGRTPPRLHSQCCWHGSKHRLHTGHKMADPGSVPAVSERDLLTQWWGMQICPPTQKLPGGQWESDRLLWLIKGKNLILLSSLDLLDIKITAEIIAPPIFWFLFTQT